MTSSNLATRWRWAVLRPLWIVARLVAVALVIMTGVTLFARHYWLSDLLANLRMQQCLLLLAALVIFLAGRRWTWLAAMIVCSAIHVPWFFSAFSPHAEAGPNAELLTITLTNVLTSNQRHEEIIADVLSRDPDVVVILELSTALAARLDSRMKSTYAHSIVRPMDAGNFGIGLYSRHLVEESKVFTLNTEIESISAKIRVDGNSYRIFATHPLPPMGDRGYRLRNEHLQQLATTIRDTTADTSVPSVLVGDLNLTPWSPHFEAFQRESGLRCAGDGFNFKPTWYRYPAFPFGLVLDHAMVSEGIVCTGHTVGPSVGSDHRSVTVCIRQGPIH